MLWRAVLGRTGGPTGAQGWPLLRFAGELSNSAIPARPELALFDHHAQISTHFGPVPVRLNVSWVYSPNSCPITGQFGRFWKICVRIFHALACPGPEHGQLLSLGAVDQA
jgi:hypothetical protein